MVKISKRLKVNFSFLWNLAITLHYCSAVMTFRSGQMESPCRLPIGKNKIGPGGTVWAKYWEKKKDSETDPVAEKETIIPLSASSLEDSRYNPPDKPVLQVGNTECPEALLSPIRNYHEGILRQDWEKVRQAWPNFDLDAAAHPKANKGKLFRYLLWELDVHPTG